MVYLVSLLVAGDHGGDDEEEAGGPEQAGGRHQVRPVVGPGVHLHTVQYSTVQYSTVQEYTCTGGGLLHLLL